MIITRKGLSGTEIQIDTAHPLTGCQVVVTDDGNLTGLTVAVLGYVSHHHYNTIAIQLPDGRMTTKSPEQLGLVTSCPFCGKQVDEYRVIHEPIVKQWPEPGDSNKQVLCHQGQWVHAKIKGKDILFRMSATIE